VSDRRRRLLVAAFVVLSLAFMVLSVRSAWIDRDTDIFPGITVVAAVLVLWCIGVLLGLVSWVVILGVDGRRLRGGFLAAQLGKYVPGAVVQIVGQIGFAVDAGVSLRFATVSLSVFAVTQASAGLALTPLVAVLPDVATPLRVVALFAIPALFVLDRRWMIAVLRRLRRLDTSSPGELVASQRTITKAWGLNILSLISASIAYGLVLSSVSSAGVFPASVAFVAAWTVGFVVFPIPAGLGLREVVLFGLLSPFVDGDIVVAASVVHRLLAISVEVGLAGIGMAMRRGGGDVAVRSPDV